MFDQQTRPAALAALVGRLASMLGPAVAALWSWRRDDRLLCTLRPEELRELGLRRSEIGRFEFAPVEPSIDRRSPNDNQPRRR